MATFELTGPDGGTYHVDAPDEGAALKAFSTFSGGKGAPAPDKYQQAAIDEAKSNPGIDKEAGYTRRLVHGYTFGADNTIEAAAVTPFEMIKHGTFDPREGYNYAKAREDRLMNKSRENTGLVGDATEMLGGAVSGGGLASAGVTAARMLAPGAGLAARTAASAVDAGALGAVSGFNEGNGLTERATNAAKGLGTGVLLGGAVPVAGAIAHGVSAPIFANIRARANPEGFAESQFARVIHDSGQTPQQIGQAVQDANAAGLPFTPADAMGNAGQKALAAVVRGPGEGSTEAVRFLDTRQAGQGRRVTNTLSEGFDTRMTPAQLEARMTEARGAQADADYGAVRHDAQPVDLSNVLDHIDQHVAPLGVPHDRIAPDGITGRMLAYRRMLGGNATELDGTATGGVNDFGAAQNVRSDLADEIQKATRAGENNKARLLGGVLRQLDESLENASPGFRQANADFRGASQDIAAIDQGRTAATRGRTEDTIPAFNALRPRGQQAFRTGYADPLIANTQGAAVGANKARPLINDAFRDEAAVVAPRNAQMQQNLERENTMFETRARAMGGSKTAENLADDAAMSVDPHLITNIVTGNWHGALRNVLSAGHSAMTGNTPAVRAAVGRMLLDRGVNPANLQAAIGATVARIQFIQNLSRNLGRGAAGALAVSRPGQTVN
jgi:hypothetical protein